MNCRAPARWSCNATAAGEASMRRSSCAKPGSKKSSISRAGSMRGPPQSIRVCRDIRRANFLPRVLQRLRRGLGAWDIGPSPDKAAASVENKYRKFRGSRVDPELGHGLPVEVGHDKEVVPRLPVDLHLIVFFLDLGRFRVEPM